jgi:phosphatidylserine/phosphatidylglycerophosphate/cardiolipin synthase-like enzyme
MSEPKAIVGNKFCGDVCELIEHANHNIDIVIFDWRVYPQGHVRNISIFNERIFSARERGVRVRALVNNETVLNFLKQQGVEAKKYELKKLLHTKLLIIDRKTIVLGSHNYTESAFSSNHEVSVSFTLTDSENDFIRYFEDLWPL